MAVVQHPHALPLPGAARWAVQNSATLGLRGAASGPHRPGSGRPYTLTYSLGPDGGAARAVTSTTGTWRRCATA